MDPDDRPGAVLETRVEPDGRRARRERGRAAVIDAFFALLDDGHPSPSIETLVERSGVSPSSVFRYFDNVDDLRHQVIEVHFARHARLFDLPDQDGAPAQARIRGLVTARLELHEATAPVARLARARAHDHPLIQTTLHQLRERFSDQVATHLAPELNRCRPAAAADLVGLVATLTSFEAWDLLVDAGRTRRQIQRAWITGLEALVAPPASDEPGRVRP